MTRHIVCGLGLVLVLVPWVRCRASPNIVADSDAAGRSMIMPDFAANPISPQDTNMYSGVETATFEDFAEGFVSSPSFIDPLSGITFSLSTGSGGSFVVEYAKRITMGAAMFQDNKYLTTNGYAAGDGAFLGANFGFTASLPQLAGYVELDVAGFASISGIPFKISLLARDSGGSTVGAQTIMFATAPPQQHHLMASSAVANIASFQVVTQGTGFNGVDNINAPVPEPFTSVAGMIVLIARLRRKSNVTINDSGLPNPVDCKRRGDAS